MKIGISTHRNLFTENREQIKEALQQALHQTLLMHKRAGNPIASWQDGKVVIIQPEDIIVEDLSAKDKA
jgi:hypothetical protein